VADVVIVTGAGSGIGRATTARLLSDGFDAVGVDVNIEALRAVEAEVANLGGRFRPVLGDVADRATHQRSQTIAAELGSVSAWVGCAGIVGPKDLLDLSEDDARSVMRVNQDGMLWGIAEAVRGFLAMGRPGAIVAISSIHAHRADPSHALYEMSKASVEALVRNVAVTYARYGVRANAIAPGAVLTPALQQSLASAVDPVAARVELERMSPSERIAAPSEVASVVSFLLGSDSSYISGATISVDGGWGAALTSMPANPDTARDLPPTSDPGRDVTYTKKARRGAHGG